MTAKSPTAVASASPAFSGWHRAAIPCYTGAVPWAFGRDDGGEAARWRDGEASPAAQAAAGSAAQGRPFELRAGGARAVTAGLGAGHENGGRARHLP